MTEKEIEAVKRFRKTHAKWISTMDSLKDNRSIGYANCLYLNRTGFLKK